MVSDSTYVKTLPPGCILDYNPPVGQRVKEGRIVYLTINTLNVPLADVPDVADNSSLREAEARLLVAGFKLTENDTVPGERDWVYGVKYQDRLLGERERVPLGSTLTIVVGDGNGELVEESDSLENVLPGEEIQPEETGAADESWF